MIDLPNVVLLCGGRGTRIQNIAKDIPKAMIKIAGRPFIAHQLDYLKSNGIKKVIICAGYLANKIIKYVQDGSSFGLEVQYSLDGKTNLGTGGAVKKALCLSGREFFVIYGDSYFDADLQKIYGYYKNHKMTALMVIIKNNNKWDKSNVDFDNGTITKYVKGINSEKVKYIDYGISLLNKNIFDKITIRNPFDLKEVFVKLIRNNKLTGYEVFNRFYEIGTPEGLKETKKYMEAKNGL